MNPDTINTRANKFGWRQTAGSTLLQIGQMALAIALAVGAYHHYFGWPENATPIWLGLAVGVGLLAVGAMIIHDFRALFISVFRASATAALGVGAVLVRVYLSRDPKFLTPRETSVLVGCVVVILVVVMVLRGRRKRVK
jgi:hypothetical protein